MAGEEMLEKLCGENVRLRNENEVLKYRVKCLDTHKENEPRPQICFVSSAVQALLASQDKQSSKIADCNSAIVTDVTFRPRYFIISKFNSELRDLVLQLPERIRNTESPATPAPAVPPPPSLRGCSICTLQKPLTDEWRFCSRCRRINGCWA